MFGIMEALLSFIRRQVGLRTDAASSTGSLHAKVTEARSSIMTLLNTIAGKNIINYGTAIKSIQRGVTAVDGTATPTATITAVTTTKAVVIATVNSASSDEDVSSVIKLSFGATAVLTNSTTLTFAMSPIGTSSQSNFASISWQVIEFY